MPQVSEFNWFLMVFMFFFFIGLNLISMKYLNLESGKKNFLSYSLFGYLI